MGSQLRACFVLFALLTVLTGVAYPLLVTGVAQVVFPDQANGSLIVRDGKVVGSELIGQQFAGEGYFWGRPSATGPAPYNAASSTGSNLGPTNPALNDAVRDRAAALHAAHPERQTAVPVDLVTASGSGLDPHITPAAAEYQASRVARVRGLGLERVREMIRAHTQRRTIELMGEPRVNVLRLNLALDEEVNHAR